MLQVEDEWFVSWLVSYRAHLWASLSFPAKCVICLISLLLKTKTMVQKQQHVAAHSVPPLVKIQVDRLQALLTHWCKSAPLHMAGTTATVLMCRYFRYCHHAAAAAA